MLLHPSRPPFACTFDNISNVRNIVRSMSDPPSPTPYSAVPDVASSSPPTVPDPTVAGRAFGRSDESGRSSPAAAANPGPASPAVRSCSGQHNCHFARRSEAAQPNHKALIIVAAVQKVNFQCVPYIKPASISIHPSGDVTAAHVWVCNLTRREIGRGERTECWFAARRQKKI